VALADKLYVTKLDLFPEEREPLFEELGKLNPRATIWTREDEKDPLELLSAGMVRPSGTLDVAYWLAPVAEAHQHSLLTPHSHEHSHVRSFVVEVDGPIDFQEFAAWASFFTQFNGERLLRMKALVSEVGRPGYLAVDAIRSFVHPPTSVPAAAHAPRKSFFVFILNHFSDEEEEVTRNALLGFRREESSASSSSAAV
ncbi:MAG: GTP-binding protein, partial [Polyangiaceae bacterium]|nr:GTP-binding protein [Polyangiaceae bacterium]